MIIIDLLKKLVEMKGSDLHLLAGLPPAVRVYGELVALADYERFTPDGLQGLLYSILTDEQRETFEHDKDTRYELDFAYGVSGLGRFRVNIHKQRGTTAATFRALAAQIPLLADLGLPDSVRAFTTAKRGLVLVTGPTGSGKSTTLAALIDSINTNRTDHIVTIEDPIEYLHKSKKAYVTQREVGPAGDTLSFKNALRAALRQDPDVILIGEMRDFETIGIAITSAETGHLVFGTLHTSSAAQTIDRIVDVFPSEQQPQVRVQLASNLLGVISQVLLPRVDEPGRCMACEVMMCNFAIRNNIRMGKTEAMIQTLQTGLADGMQTMDQSLLKLCKEGKIDYEIAKPFIYDKSTHETLKMFSRRPAPRPAEPGAAPRPSPGQPPWERKS
ncbi:MAG: type IV pilus twitching motility protein PilT [Candidatus Aminicenantes bacterium]|nr:type IV pilus twitching motility protein PilT [Candidatus Aminicenantes bacterium]